MKQAKKALLLLLCAALLVGASVAGTLAYLTDSEDVTNTFTVGSVHIKLDEANVNAETGEATTGRTENGNTAVRMVPGRTIDKDPTVTVLEGSEDCYVRVKVTVDVSSSWTNDQDAIDVNLIKEGYNFEYWASQFAGNYLLHKEGTDVKVGFNTVNWTVSAPDADEKARTITYFLTYKKGTDAIVEKDTDEDTVLEAIFDEVHVPSSLTNEQLALLKGMSIKVEAHAIQADGFMIYNSDGNPEYKAAEQKAWKAFDDQMNPPPAEENP